MLELLQIVFQVGSFDEHVGWFMGGLVGHPLGKRRLIQPCGSEAALDGCRIVEGRHVERIENHGSAGRNLLMNPRTGQDRIRRPQLTAEVVDQRGEWCQTH